MTSFLFIIIKKMNLWPIIQSERDNIVGFKTFNSELDKLLMGQDSGWIDQTARLTWRREV